MTQGEAEKLASFIAYPKARIEIIMEDWLDEDSYVVKVFHPDRDSVTLDNPDAKKSPVDWPFLY